VEAIARLNAECGSNRLLPSKSQRESIYRGVFGGPETGPAGDETSKFARLRGPLFHAVALCGPETSHSTTDILRENVRESLVPFRQHLANLGGASVRWSRRCALAEIADNVAFPILRDSGIAARFGQCEAPAEDWPFVFDANGDQLVSCLLDFLPRSPRGAFTPSSSAQLASDFTCLQRAAQRGAEALAAVLDSGADEGSEATDALIQAMQRWKTALVGTSRTETTYHGGDDAVGGDWLDPHMGIEAPSGELLDSHMATNAPAVQRRPPLEYFGEDADWRESALRD
jgi:hypothetical protein